MADLTDVMNEKIKGNKIIDTKNMPTKDKINTFVACFLLNPMPNQVGSFLLS